MKGIGLQKLPDLLFRDLENLKNLDLSSNSLEILPVNTFRPLNYVQFIDLSRNKLTVIENQLFERNYEKWILGFKIQFEFPGSDFRLHSLVSDAFSVSNLGKISI